MNFTVTREVLLKPLQAVIGVIERRQTMPILANLLLVIKNDQLSITATDLEVELVASTEVDVKKNGEITVSGRKFFDICKALPEKAELTVQLSGEKLSIKSGRSKFTLMTLPGADFPTVDDINAIQTVSLPQVTLGTLLEKTHFSMAQQDVRYYLNGLLIETDGQYFRAVATDGHRLALCQITLDSEKTSEQQVIVPRKGVLELQRLVSKGGDINLQLGNNHIRVEFDGIRFTSKLIDGKFPDYERVIPQDNSNYFVANKLFLQSALQRTAILSNEKYRGIRLIIRDSGIVLHSHNPEQEEAEEELEVSYKGEDIEIGFNVNYLLEAIGAIESDKVTLAVVDGNSSCLIHEPGNEDCKYVVMPMRLSGP